MSMKPAENQEHQRKVDRLARRYAVMVSEVDIFEALGAVDRHSEPLPAETIDISPEGVRLRCEKSFPPGTLVKVEINIPDWERYDHHRLGGLISYPSKPFVVLAEPVWSKDRGLDKETGLRFVNIHRSHRDALKNLVEENA